MTFNLIDELGNETTIDLETLDDLTALAERYGWRKLTVDVWNMTIRVEG